MEDHVSRCLLGCWFVLSVSSVRQSISQQARFKNGILVGLQFIVLAGWKTGICGESGPAREMGVDHPGLFFFGMIVMCEDACLTPSHRTHVPWYESLLERDDSEDLFYGPFFFGWVVVMVSGGDLRCGSFAH